MDNPKRRSSRRGRPRKREPQQVALVQARRARMRRAQEAFRARQKAAQDAEKQLLTKQETAMNQMASSFVDFVEFLVRSETFQGDSHLMQKLHETIRQFIAAHDLNNSPQEEEVTPTTPQDLNTATNTNPLLSSLFSSGVFPPENIFSNGWLDYLPTSFTQLDDSWQSQQSDTSQFSRNLVYCTMNIAYQALSGSPGFPLELAERIFRFSLLLHRKEELLFNLRWFLGPGNQELIRLAFVSFAATTINAGPLTLADTPGVPSLLPAVDVYATDYVTPVSKDADRVSATRPFLNAREVEQYLRDKGARFLDAETIEMTIPGSHPRRGELLEGLFPFQTVSLPNSSEFSGTVPGHAPMSEAVTTGGSHRLPTADLTASADVQLGITSEIRNLFSCDELPEEPVRSPERLPSSPKLYSQSEHQAHTKTSTFRIQTSVLLQNLACIGLCLSKGPGYVREYVDHAICKSIVR